MDYEIHVQIFRNGPKCGSKFVDLLGYRNQMRRLEPRDARGADGAAPCWMSGCANVLGYNKGSRRNPLLGNPPVCQSAPAPFLVCKEGATSPGKPESDVEAPGRNAEGGIERKGAGEDPHSTDRREGGGGPPAKRRGNASTRLR